MKILVIDDRLSNRTSALVTLRDHKVTICGGDFPGSRTPLHNLYMDLQCGVVYDALLTDLMMPASEEEGHAKGQDEVSYGMAIAFQAALAGIPLVGIVTNANHHRNPLLYALEGSHPGCARALDVFRKPFVLNGSKVRFMRDLTWREEVGTTCGACGGTAKRKRACLNCRATGVTLDWAEIEGSPEASARKDWGKALQLLLE